MKLCYFEQQGDIDADIDLSETHAQHSCKAFCIALQFLNMPCQRSRCAHMHGRQVMKDINVAASQTSAPPSIPFTGATRLFLARNSNPRVAVQGSIELRVATRFASEAHQV